MNGMIQYRIVMSQNYVRLKRENQPGLDKLGNIHRKDGNEM